MALDENESGNFHSHTRTHKYMFVSQMRRQIFKYFNGKNVSNTHTNTFTRAIIPESIYDAIPKW